MLLCQWHVTQAWGRNYKKTKVSSKNLGAALGKLMHGTSPSDHNLEAKERAAIETIRQTLRDLNTGPAWSNYFEEQWIQTYPPRMWMTALRADVHRGPSETTGAIESFHRQLKSELKHNISRAARMDELVHVLDEFATKTAWFEAIGYLKREPNKQQAVEVNKAVQAAHHIPDERVHPPGAGEVHWAVDSSSEPGRRYTVDPSHELGCTCPRVNQRVTCKHIIKVLKTKEPRLSDQRIVAHLGKAWGTEHGTIKSMLQAMRPPTEPPESAAEEVAAAATLELPPRQPREEPEPRRSERRRALPSTLEDFQVDPPRRIARSRVARQPEDTTITRQEVIPAHSA